MRYLSETWWNALVTIEKSLFKLPNHNSTNQPTGYHEGGGVSTYIHKSLDITVKLDLSNNNNDISYYRDPLKQKKEKL